MKVEDALKEQKVKGRRMIIEEVDGSESESEYDTPPENDINGHNDDSDVDISNVAVRETKKPESQKDTKPTPKVTKHETKPTSKPTSHQKDATPSQKTVKTDVKSEDKTKHIKPSRPEPSETKTEKAKTVQAEKAKPQQTEREMPKKSETKIETKTQEKVKPTESKLKSDESKAKPEQTKPVEVERPKTPPPLPKAVADLKAKGNDLFKSGQYGDAIEAYSKAVQKLKSGELLEYYV